jgi:hypothetical protein
LDVRYVRITWGCMLHVVSFRLYVLRRWCGTFGQCSWSVRWALYGACVGL